MSEPVEIARCDARYKADLLVELLDDAGIPAAIQGTAGGYGERAVWGVHRVMVRADDRDRAAEIVEGWWQKGENGDG